jgi:pimeloyl-ACP methyl ester carboxylesterase
MTGFVSALRARGLAVAAIDAAAHGASGGARNNLVWMTADAVAVAHTLRPVAFVGHSMGAVVGVRAARAGISFERLVLLAPPAEFEPYFVAFARAVGLTDRAFACMIERFRTELGTRFDELTAEWLSVDALPSALVVYDDDDEDTPPAHARRWVERWPSRVESMQTSELGHRAILRDRAVIERVAEFLSAP